MELFTPCNSSVSTNNDMSSLKEAINNTPIIDNHAHPLLTAAGEQERPILSITTEAGGEALHDAPSTMSHIRAVKQLSRILNCAEDWDVILQAIKIRKSKPDNEWHKKCFEGIETALLDDGLDSSTISETVQWHNTLTKSRCFRIVRIEPIAEKILTTMLTNPKTFTADIFLSAFVAKFEFEIQRCLEDDEVVGFKSVICYRTGLDVPPRLSSSEFESLFINYIKSLKDAGVKTCKRLDHPPMNTWILYRAADLIVDVVGQKKPLQFHCGLGDNDITLARSSASQLQGFIRQFPTLPIVLLHANYPWTKEAGYLASVYENVYADIGEVFPMVSRHGQETVVKEILELCPTSKMLWSTDGHWYPETYLLAVMQVREALEVVFCEMVEKGDLSVPQAITAVQDILFNTSNKLYGLDLTLTPLKAVPSLSDRSDVMTLTRFLAANPKTKYLRIEWLDYTSLHKSRILPIDQAKEIIASGKGLHIGITKASLGLLQNDTIIPEVTPIGEYRLHADFSSIRPGPFLGTATIQGDFREADGSEAKLCPRSTFRRILATAKSHSLEFRLGFEIEIVFLKLDAEGHVPRTEDIRDQGHAWSSTRAIADTKILAMVEEVCETFKSSGIKLEQFHPESSNGQWEFVLGHKPALEAVDTLLSAREIIVNIAYKNGYRATLHPKPYPTQAGTASHVHISISSPNGNKPEIYEPFYAGVLKHMRAIIAFTYSNPASYQRAVASCWAGGVYAAWGTQNRETALRKIEDSHFEIKTMDGMANMYLAMSAIIACGTQGVVDKEKLMIGDCLQDPSLLSEEERAKLGIRDRLPSSIEEALHALANDEVVEKLLGTDLCSRYRQVKIGEMKLYEAMNEDLLKAWTIERY